MCCKFTFFQVCRVHQGHKDFKEDKEKPEIMVLPAHQGKWAQEVFLVSLERMENLVKMESPDQWVHLAPLEEGVFQECRVSQDLKVTAGFLDLMVLKALWGPLVRRASLELMGQWEHLVLLDQQVHVEKEDEKDHLVLQVYEALMASLDHQENQEQLESLGLLDFRAPLDQRVIWAFQVLREVLVFKAQGVRVSVHAKDLHVATLLLQGLNLTTII